MQDADNAHAIVKGLIEDQYLAEAIDSPFPHTDGSGGLRWHRRT
jgi:hypothetical protein